VEGSEAAACPEPEVRRPVVLVVSQVKSARVPVATAAAPAEAVAAGPASVAVPVAPPLARQVAPAYPLGRGAPG